MKFVLKRTVALLLTLCLAVGLSSHGLAYKKSPGGWGGGFGSDASVDPDVGPGGNHPVSAKDSSGEDVTSWIIVTPYEERNTLPAHHLAAFEKGHEALDMQQCYDHLKRGSVLPEAGELTPMAVRRFAHAEPAPVMPAPRGEEPYLMRRLAIKENPDHWIGAEYLDVKHEFYVHEYEDRGMIEMPVTLTLHVNAHEHDFLGFFEYVDDDWQKLTFHDNDDGTITFDVAQWGPFAVLYQTMDDPAPDTNPDTKPEVESPQTGESDLLPLCMAAAAVGSIALLAVVCLRKKRV